MPPIKKEAENIDENTTPTTRHPPKDRVDPEIHPAPPVTTTKAPSDASQSASSLHRRCRRRRRRLTCNFTQVLRNPFPFFSLGDLHCKTHLHLMAGRLNLDGEAIPALKICMIGAGGFIGSHLCEKLMWETEHSVLAIDVYGDKIHHLLQPGQAWSDRIEFHKINIKSDSRLEGLIKVSDLVRADISFPLPPCPCISKPFTAHNNKTEVYGTVFEMGSFFNRALF